MLISEYSFYLIYYVFHYSYKRAKRFLFLPFIIISPLRIIIGKTIMNLIPRRLTPGITIMISEKGNTIPNVCGWVSEKGNAIPNVSGRVSEKGNAIPNVCGQGPFTPKVDSGQSIIIILLQMLIHP